MIELGSSLPTLESRRVRLRWLDDEDIPALYEIFSNPSVMRYWSSEPLETIPDAACLLEEIRGFFRARTLFQWGLARRSDDVVVGTCTLAHIDRRNRRCELGFALHPNEWGKGFATEAVTLLLSWAFRELGLHRVEADIDPRNEASIRLVERLGFRREGLLRERYHLYGETQDSLIFGLLAKDFDDRR